VEQASETVSKPETRLGNDADPVGTVLGPPGIRAQRAAPLRQESLRRPFRDSFILHVIRHPGLRSGVQSVPRLAELVGQASCLSLYDGPDARPAEEGIAPASTPQ
jgi:hypothetical protein